MLNKTTKEILLEDLLEIKKLLVETFDDSEVPFIKGGAIDQFFIGKAIEFQKNIILYDTLMNSKVMVDDVQRVDKNLDETQSRTQ